MALSSRQAQFLEQFPKEPTFRWRQLETALFNPLFRSWDDITTLPKTVREYLNESVKWMSVRPVTIQESKNKDTFKAAMEVEGEKQIETVLMKNRREQWTICVSSQVGCAMRCGFCATGKMGLTRNLTRDEIIDQYRFWNVFLTEHPELPQRISNVVFMGMGEPLANYEEVKATLNTWLKQTDIGQTRITVSTVGILPRLEQILTDTDWPHIRLAVSLHSAIEKTRKEIVPTSYDNFLPTLADWARRYLETFGNRRHHLTFEYVMLKDVNDTDLHAQALANFVHSIGDVRVNLIPYNFTDSVFACSTNERITRFIEQLEKSGTTVMRRRTMGDDIAAACGQLIVSSQKQVRK